MSDSITADELIESLVNITHGHSEQRLQHAFRQNLQLLVGLAKLEQRNETDMDLQPAARCVSRGVMH